MKVNIYDCWGVLGISVKDSVVITVASLFKLYTIPLMKLYVCEAEKAEDKSASVVCFDFSKLAFKPSKVAKELNVEVPLVVALLTTEPEFLRYLASFCVTVVPIADTDVVFM